MTQVADGVEPSVLLRTFALSAVSRMLSGTVKRDVQLPPAFKLGSNSGTPFAWLTSLLKFGSKVEG